MLGVGLEEKGRSRGINHLCLCNCIIYSYSQTSGSIVYICLAAGKHTAQAHSVPQCKKISFDESFVTHFGVTHGRRHQREPSKEAAGGEHLVECGGLAGRRGSRRAAA